MKPKNGFPLLIAIAMIFSLAPAAAHADQQKGNSPSSPQIAPATISVPYRLTYTLTEMNDGKRAGSQRYVIVVNASPRYFMPSYESRPAHLKLGTRIPLASTKSKESQGQLPPLPSQITYIDIGMDIDATLRLTSNGLNLSTHVNQSAIDSQKSSPLGPVIRQASFETTTLLNANKPTVIGNVDLPGTTRTLQIQVEARKLQ